MSTDLQIKSLGEVFKLEYGRPLPKESRDENGDYPAYGANGVKCRTNQYYWNKPSIIVGRKGSAGEVTLSEGKFWPLDVTYFVVFDDKQYALTFLYHCLQSLNLTSLAKGVKPGLNRNDVYRLQFAFPPLSEQKRIVSILDEAFAGIATAVANTEKNLANARELFDSYLNNVFTQKREGWAEKRLQDVCEKITDGTHQTPKYFDDGVTFLSSRNVTSGTIDWENIKYIDTKQHLEMHRRVAPRVGDILLAKNGTTGVAAIVDRDVVFDIYVSLALLRSLGEVRPRYLLYFINSPVAKQQFNKRLKGIGVPNLHLQEIREVVLGFPSDLSQQDAIVKRSDLLNAEVCRLESLYQHKLTTLAELKQSLLHKAFSGALTAQPERALQEAVA